MQKTSKNQLRTALAFKIFLDRYALKDIERKTLSVRDPVVCLTNSKTGDRELGIVSKVHLNGHKEVVVSMTTGKNAGTEQTFDWEMVDKPIETEPDQMIRRLASTFAKGSASYDSAWISKYTDALRTPSGLTLEDIFYECLSDWKFVPAGRIQAGAGATSLLTCFNCYVIPSPKDSRKGINDTLAYMTEIMSRGGGVGINLSSLRYRGAYVRGVNGRSSGSVSWGEEYSRRTGKVEQGGSRRGALMLMLCDWHPDIFDFIDAKRDNKFANNCNMSIVTSDAFMKAVEDDANWDLVFPNTISPTYTDQWDGDLEKWKRNGGEVNIVRTVRAREIWEKWMASNWAAAEPGVMYVDTYNRDSNSQYYANGHILCTNPCGEQGLPPHAVCNLGHINLSRFVKHLPEVSLGAAYAAFYTVSSAEQGMAYVDTALLEQTVRTAVRALDSVYDITYYVTPENEEQAAGERRIGLGTMGLAEMLLRLGITYGDNPVCLEFLEALYSRIAIWAYMESIELARERGAFKFCDKALHAKLPFVKKLSEKANGINLRFRFVDEYNTPHLYTIDQAIVRFGIRNVTLITQAPTGTVGTMMDTSTGIEPFPWFEWVRKGRIGEFQERAFVAEDYVHAISSVSKVPVKELPAYFVAGADAQRAISPVDHVKTQVAIQRWTDSSISKTSNLPAGATAKDVATFYFELFKQGAKGGTIYRDKSRDEQVLMSTDDARITIGKAEPVKAPEVDGKQDYWWEPEARTSEYFREGFPAAGRPGWNCAVITPMGRLHVNITFSKGQPFEIFLMVGKGGTEVYAMAEALGRSLSVFLQLYAQMSPAERLQVIHHQLRGIGGSEQEGFGPKKIKSMPDGVARAIEIFLESFPDGVYDPDLRVKQPKPVPVEEEHDSLRPAANPHAVQVGDLQEVPASTRISTKTKNARDLCPACGSSALEHSAGCTTCRSCGHSKC